MRGLPFLVPIAAVVVVASGCSRSEARSVDRAAATSGADVAAVTVRDTVRAGETFELAWPNTEAPRACIRIPADAVAAGTEVSIDLVTEKAAPEGYPRRFRQATERGLEVFPPVVRISADPGFRIEDPESHATVGICAIVPQGRAFADARLAHNDPDDPDALEELPIAEPCTLTCGRSPAHYDRETGMAGPIDWLLAGTPLRPDPLVAETAAEGLGGKSGSLSPFAVVSGR